MIWDEWDELVCFDVDSLITESKRRIAELSLAVAEQDAEPDLSLYWVDIGGSE